MSTVSTAKFIFLFTLLIFTSLTGLTFATIALWRIFWNNAKELKTVDKCTIHSTVSCIILHAMTVILDVIGFYFNASGQDLLAFNIVWVVIWTLSKMSLYFIYIYRVYITFKDTKYAYSQIKIYIALIVAMLLQIYNMIIFILYHLKSFNDQIIIILSSTYLIFDTMVILLILFLFLNPIINLMTDLTTKSDHLMNIRNNSDETQSLKNINQKSDSSSCELTEMTSHSPTKMGAVPQRRIAQTVPVNTSNSVATLQPGNTLTVKSSINSTLRDMKHFGRLPCPEDEVKETEHSNTYASKTFSFNFFNKKRKKHMIWNEKQKQILNTGTRLALLSVIGLSSTFFYQFIWIISVGLNVLGKFSYTWGVDTCINIVCIYLSFQFAEIEYKILCTKCCCCHGCCLKCVENEARKRAS